MASGRTECDHHNFRWYGLVENVVKSKGMKFQKGKIRSGMLKEAVGHR